MAKTSKKALGAAMAGVMAVGAVAGAVQSLDQVKVANAAESQTLSAAKAKISHLTYSLKNNYLGIKNQGQWEEYIKEARKLILAIPSAEKAQADALTDEVNKDEQLVKAVAGINQVEKSLLENNARIGNVKQWTEYLNNAKESLKSVNQTVFGSQYAELIERLGKAETSVKKIEDDFKVALESATKLYNTARESMILSDANKALEAAKKLGTADETTALLSKINALINLIEKGEIDVKTIGVVEKTYDDNTKNQRLLVKVNGETTNIDFLKGAGYSLSFSAVNVDSKKSADIFDTNNDKSTTGKLKDLLNEGDYEVSVTATKGGSIIVSDKAVVKVRNLDSTATEVTKADLERGDGVVLSSTTLVADEEVTVSKFEVKNGSSTTEVEKTRVKAKSSNEAVVSIVENGDGTNRIIAQTPGTAKVTLSYGDTKKEISITVTNAKRKVSKVELDKSSVTAIIGASNPQKVKLTVKDQFGDPIKGVTFGDEANDIGKTGKAAKLELIVPTDIIDNFTPADTDAKGQTTAEIAARVNTDDGRGTVLFKNEAGSALGRISVSTTKTNNVASTKLEVIKDTSSKYYSENLTITNAGATTSNKSDAKYKGAAVKVALNQYTSQSVLKGKADINLDDDVKYNNKLLKIDLDTDGKTLLITASADAFTYNRSGSSDVVVTYDGKSYKVTVKVTSESVVKISNVSWTSVTPYAGDVITATDVLKIKATPNTVDPIVESITLSPSGTAHKVRVQESNGLLYLDKNDDGSYDSSKDESLGRLYVKGTGDYSSVGAGGNAFSGVRVVSGDKGNIIFYVEVFDADDDSEIISSTAVVVK